MFYDKSGKILKEVKGAQKILVNCHRSPDPDSIGSALALYTILKKLKKDVEIVCPGKVPKDLSFFKDYKEIKSIDFSKFDFNTYDLFICLDSSSPSMVTGDKSVSLPEMPIVVIDHHATNTRFGKINLIDLDISSCAELMYRIIKDWDIDLNKRAAHYLLAGIIGDTGAFRYTGASPGTFKVAGDLIKLGADKDEIIFNLYNSYDFNLIQFWGEVLKRMHMEKDENFIWSAVSYEIYKKYSMPDFAKETSAGLFAQVVDGTDFGIIMVEQDEKTLSLSLRSRTGIDVSKIAAELGGGGHIYAAGAKIEGMPFDEAVKEALKVAKKYAKKIKN